MRRTLGNLFLLCILGCGSHRQVLSSISCGEKVTFQYDKLSKADRRDGVLADANQNSALVYFENTFDDSIKAYLNGEIIFDAFVKTDNSKASADTLFGFRNSNKGKTGVLKIVSKNKGCIEFNVNRDYKLIYLFFTEEQGWIVRFSNTYYLHN
jgi:hypothetical protein